MPTISAITIWSTFIPSLKSLAVLTNGYHACFMFCRSWFHHRQVSDTIFDAGSELSFSQLSTNSSKKKTRIHAFGIKILEYLCLYWWCKCIQSLWGEQPEVLWISKYDWCPQPFNRLTANRKFIIVIHQNVFSKLDTLMAYWIDFSFATICSL